MQPVAVTPPGDCPSVGWPGVARPGGGWSAPKASAADRNVLRRPGCLGYRARQRRTGPECLPGARRSGRQARSLFSH
jgi:hypothetical protein